MLYWFVLRGEIDRMVVAQVKAKHMSLSLGFATTSHVMSATFLTPLFPHPPDGGNDCTYVTELLWGLNELIYVTHLEQCLTHIKNDASLCWYYCYYHVKECFILFMVRWGSTKLCQGFLLHLSRPCTLLHPSRDAQTPVWEASCGRFL